MITIKREKFFKKRSLSAPIFRRIPEPSTKTEEAKVASSSPSFLEIYSDPNDDIKIKSNPSLPLWNSLAKSTTIDQKIRSTFQSFNRLNDHFYELHYLLKKFLDLELFQIQAHYSKSELINILHFAEKVFGISLTEILIEFSQSDSNFDSTIDKLQTIFDPFLDSQEKLIGYYNLYLENWRTNPEHPDVTKGLHITRKTYQFIQDKHTKTYWSYYLGIHAGSFTLDGDGLLQFNLCPLPFIPNGRYNAFQNCADHQIYMAESLIMNWNWGPHTTLGLSAQLVLWAGEILIKDALWCFNLQSGTYFSHDRLIALGAIKNSQLPKELEAPLFFKISEKLQVLLEVLEEPIDIAREFFPLKIVLDALEQCVIKQSSYIHHAWLSNLIKLEKLDEFFQSDRQFYGFLLADIKSCLILEEKEFNTHIALALVLIDILTTKNCPKNYLTVFDRLFFEKSFKVIPKMPESELKPPSSTPCTYVALTEDSEFPAVNANPKAVYEPSVSLERTCELSRAELDVDSSPDLPLESTSFNSLPPF